MLSLKKTKMELLAKSKSYGGDTLTNHSVSVMNLALGIYDHMVDKKPIGLLNINGNDDLRDTVAIAALFHDIGKATSSFQDFLRNGKKSKAEYNDDDETLIDKRNKISHQLLSWSFLYHYTNINQSVYNKSLKNILYHHPLYYERNGLNSKTLNSFISDDIDTFKECFTELVEYLPPSVRSKIKLSGGVDGINIPNFYVLDENYNINDSIEYEVNDLIIRSCLIVADRYCSKLSLENKERLDLILKNNKDEINLIIKELIDIDVDLNNVIQHVGNEGVFDMERFNKQVDIVRKDTVNSKTSIISASAGFGKTLVGLLWSIQHKKKIVWVCPRNIIAENTYHSIISDLKYLGLDLSVALYYGGEYKENNVSEDNNVDNINFDIVVTNIDNFLSPIVKNNISNKLYNITNSFVIFDEYHELASDQPLFSEFLRLMYLRHNKTKARTLLLSATALRFDNYFWNKSGGEQVFFKKYDSPFKNNKLQLHVKDNVYYNDIKLTDNSDTSVIMNTVYSAQKLSLLNHNINNVLHARYTEEDLLKNKERLINNHNKRANIEERFTTISTRIIGTGLDISYKNLIESVVSPELTVQSIGRINRFSELKNYIPQIHLYRVTEKSEETIIEHLYNKELSRMWFDSLNEYNNNIITIGELYDIYYKFLEDNDESLKIYFKNLYSQSTKQLNSLSPFSTRKKENNRRKVGSNMGYRGVSNNSFVCARLLNDKTTISDNILIDKYLYVSRYDNYDDKESSAGDKERITIIGGLNRWDDNGIHLRNLNKLTYRDFKDLSVYSDTPLVMLEFYYDEKLGLIHKELLND